MFVRFLLCGFVIFLVSIIYMVNSGTLPDVWNFLYGIPYLDKIGHFFLMGTLSVLANLSLRCRTFQLVGKPVMVGTVVVIIVVRREEFSLAFIATRSCDAADFAADLAGILVGAWIAKTLHRFSNRRLTQA